MGITFGIPYISLKSLMIKEKKNQEFLGSWLFFGIFIVVYLVDCKQVGEHVTEQCPSAPPKFRLGSLFVGGEKKGESHRGHQGSRHSLFFFFHLDI